MTLGCKNRNKRSESSYQLDKPGVAQIAPSYAPNRFRLHEYTLDGDLLTLTAYKDPESKTVYQTKEMKKVELASNEKCLPAQVTVSRQEFARYYKIPQLIETHFSSVFGSLLVDEFIDKKLRNIPIEAASPQNIRRLLIEFDKIIADFDSIIQKRLQENPKSILDAYFQVNKYDPASDAKLAMSEKQLWANHAVREILETRNIAAYLHILTRMFKDHIASEYKRLDVRKKDRVNKLYGIGDSYALSRELLRSGYLEMFPEEMLPISRNTLAELRVLSFNNTDLAKSQNYTPALPLEKNTGRAAALFLKNDKKEWGKIEKNVKDKLKTLSARFWMTLDKTTLKHCEIKGIDYDALISSKGDWRKVNTHDGVSIAPASKEHLQLLRFYSNGCSGKKDFSLTRKILEDIANAPKSKKNSISPEVKYCKLALWTRYGIGGKRSEKKATDWEKKFRSEAFQVRMNPTDEEIATIEKSYKKSYPQFASNNFLCPKPSGKSLIDPRNPWVDLR